MNEFPVILDFRDFRKIISITIDRSKIDMYSFLFFFFFFLFFLLQHLAHRSDRLIISTAEIRRRRFCVLEFSNRSISFFLFFTAR